MVDALDALVLIDNPTVASREMQLRQASGTGEITGIGIGFLIRISTKTGGGGGGIVLVVRF